MKCEYCGKEIKRKWARKYCDSDCRNKYIDQRVHNLCRCGNRKYISSKKCRKCHISNKRKGLLSRTKYKINSKK